MYNKNRNIILLVEGADDEVKLFKKIIQCFPEIELSPDNILIYNTNLWVLNEELNNLFGSDWTISEDIDFREFLKAKYPEIKGQKITDIFLVFDYERQDNRFNPDRLEALCRFFNDSVENGQLYINYPMVEAYRHLNVKPLPDDTYKDRKCYLCDVMNYKRTVGQETKFHDCRKYDRETLKHIILHNLKKISYMSGGLYDIDKAQIGQMIGNIDYGNIAKCQNDLSSDENGFIYVLCTCVLFVAEYNKKLVIGDE